MPIKRKVKTSKKITKSKGIVYLTARALERAVIKGTKNEKADAIRLMGYTVVEKNGWVVREFADGNFERISEIVKADSSAHFFLD